MAGLRGALGRFGGTMSGVASLYQVVKELSFDDLRCQAELPPPRLLLIGPDPDALGPLRTALVGAGSEYAADTAAADALPASLRDYDVLVVVEHGPGEAASAAIRGRLAGTGLLAAVFPLRCAVSTGSAGEVVAATADLETLRRKIVAQTGLEIALGRHLPAFRPAVTQATIQTTARANAEFALLSSLPALIPVVGSFMAVGADFLVLTKNQLMLLYKIAAIHGRDLHTPQRLYAEMLPVVAGGLVWRGVARELAGLLPFASGTIPKVLIAYAGTVSVGQAAALYYDEGRRPSAEQMRDIYARALETARALGLPDLPGMPGMPGMSRGAGGRGSTDAAPAATGSAAAPATESTAPAAAAPATESTAPAAAAPATESTAPAAAAPATESTAPAAAASVGTTAPTPPASATETGAPGGAAVEPPTAPPSPTGAAGVPPSGAAAVAAPPVGDAPAGTPMASGPSATPAPRRPRAKKATATDATTAGTPAAKTAPGAEETPAS